MESNYQNLVAQAQELLNAKKHSDSSIQDTFQSSLNALAKSTYDIDGAITEFKSVFSAQWKNGLVAHNLFLNVDGEWGFPTPDYWDSSINETSNPELKTSGIIHPPIYGCVLREIFKTNRDSEEVRSFVQEMFPKVLRFHDFLYFYRDAHLDGLCSIYHPWESARAESAIWDKPLGRLKIKEDNVAKLLVEEMDLDNPEVKDRYEKYISQIELGKKYAYEGEEILDSSRFLVQDCMFNAILVESNEALMEIGKEFGIDIEYLEECNELSRRFYSHKFWNDYHSCFMSFDLASNEPIEIAEIGSYMSLFAGLASEEQAEMMVEKLKKWQKEYDVLGPSIDPKNKLYDSTSKWRGAIVPEILWMICKGLNRYGYIELADAMKYDFMAHMGNTKETNDSEISFSAAGILNLLYA